MISTIPMFHSSVNSLAFVPSIPSFVKFCGRGITKYRSGAQCWRSVFRLHYEAFDTVDHCVLLSMLVLLLEIGVSPSFTKRFESNLNNRKQKKKAVLPMNC